MNEWRSYLKSGNRAKGSWCVILQINFYSSPSCIPVAGSHPVGHRSSLFEQAHGSSGSAHPEPTYSPTINMFVFLITAIKTNLGSLIK